MTKYEAKALFGGTDEKLAAALGISRPAVTMWPKDLDQERTDRVVGAAVRLGVWPGEVAQRLTVGADARLVNT